MNNTFNTTKNYYSTLFHSEKYFIIIPDNIQYLLYFAIFNHPTMLESREKIIKMQQYETKNPLEIKDRRFYFNSAANKLNSVNYNKMN